VRVAGKCEAFPRDLGMRFLSSGGMGVPFRLWPRVLDVGLAAVGGAGESQILLRDGGSVTRKLVELDVCRRLL
jgi:hypothetical protein